LIFRSRFEAGKKLADALEGHGYDNPLVLGIPRGGVPVAAAVAEELDLPLDIIVTRKIGAPFNRELALGALTPTGKTMLDEDKLARYGVDRQALEDEIESQNEERIRRITAYRGSAEYPDLSENTLVVVDDGIATGMTMKAALEGLAQEEPQALIVAVPVAPRRAISDLQQHCDELHCLHTPARFMAVSQFYERFDQVSDAEVKELMEEYGTTAG
jgi:predicted phosphoribosyltransferase